MRRLLSACLLGLGPLALACRASNTEPDPAVCAQTYEFGNFGCGDASGRIVNRSGAAVPGAYVSLKLDASAAAGLPLGAQARSDTLGRYSMRATWMSPPSTGGGRPDSATVWVYAALPTRGGQPRIADSVRVMARFSAVGSRAPSVSVPVLTLPIP